MAPPAFVIFDNAIGFIKSSAAPRSAMDATTHSIDALPVSVAKYAAKERHIKDINWIINLLR